ncbi:hypothetical protein H4R24_005425, partial [Coemansia sp. RSA 988]
GFGKPEDSISGNSTAESPEERANIFSRFMFMWVGSLLAKGYHSQLQLEDIWKMDGQFRPDVVNAQFQRNWQRELKSAKPSLFWATARAYWKIWALAAMHEFLRLTMKFLRPIVLSWLIGFAASYGTDQGSPIEHGYFYAVMLFFVSSWMNIANRQRWSYAQHIERLVRTSYMTAIYQKSLALSNNTRQKYDIGSIVTHMSVDTEIFTYSIEDVSLDMWSEPLQMGIAMFMLYHLLGWSSLVGVFALLVCTPIVSRYGQAIGARSKLLMEYRDQRMGIMNEILMGIRVVKMYAWESSFLKRINDIRIKSELDIISKNNLLNSLITAATTLVSFIVNFATFGIYSVFDNISHGPLSAQLVFVGMPLLDAVADSFGLIPGIVPDATRGIASFYRIYDFLTASEIDAFAVARDTYDRNLPESSTNDVLVKIVDGYFSWSSVGKPTLGDIAIKCKRDELVAVIGKVGSGKSSLVSAILGDMIKCSGNVMVRGSIAYVPQQPWILNATLRDNILFGSAYDEEFYNRVIDACALIQDIDTFLAGDMTEIGERGINLSGGQKMRVSLARAVYARADIYILDDPLAAVDVHVSKHLFAYVLGPQGMLQSRARILTTNALQYLHSVDSIVMLHDGKIIEQGTFEQVMDSQSDIYEFVYQLVDDNQSSEESSYLAQDNNVNKNCANESISGVSIIRAYGQQSRFISEIEDRLGKHVRINNATLLVNQWLAMHMELIGSMMILGVSILSVATIQKSGIGNADTIGLVVGAVLTLGFKMNWVVRSYSMLELSMTHLERILEYTNLPSEAANVVEDLRPKDMWPEQGVVEFKNYSMRYRDGLDLVLKNLSFHVLPRQKVGIVGRTGAGKSSLTLALFRIVEAASGQILLDGEDIAKYGLFDVRSKLSIIPQDPVLFAGTVRENLDPFNSYSDQNIWRALEQAHLAEYIRSNDERLEFMVTQSGKNFSVGQRQLICLARALLKHAKVLVLDEATAAVDNVTDEIIQRTIRNEFKDCTVLTIAHRLNTVIDSDMVLVVDNGQLAEYDTPQNLLANKGTLFSRLVEESQSVK